MCDVDDDNWLNTAMVDDTIVAKFLLTLTNSSSSSSSRNPYPPLNIHWSNRQPRSNFRTSAAKSTRASPTTPLSWSPNTSTTTAATAAITDGNEESSFLIKPLHTSRSKAVEEGEADANKRSRKKRSVPELLEDEKLLLKERGNLKDKLTSMHLTLEKERAKNASFKKIKLDLVSQKTTKTERTSLLFCKADLGPSQHVRNSSESVQHPTVQEEKESIVVVVNASSSSLQQEIGNRELPFLLPDLNLPLDEEFNANIVS